MTRMNRRFFLKSASAISLSSPLSPAEGSANYVVGAIRWDAWDATGCTACPNGSVNNAVAAALGPSKWQSRMPWFGRPTSTDSVAIDGNQQSTMDAEIAYAKAAGLNYWAYVWYGTNDPMQNAWNLHQTSAHRNDVNWCLLLQFSHMGNAAAFAEAIAAYVGYFQQMNYQTVLSGRPLLYIFMDSLSVLTKNWGGSYTNFQTSLNALRSACAAAGRPTPYIVILNAVAATAAKIKAAVSGNAIGSYYSPLVSGQPAAYAAQLASDATFWATMAATGASVVPIVQTGGDQRPRKQTPLLITKPAGSGMLNYVAAGTPAQIASDFLAAINYISANPSVCPAKAILSYSWNECDEFGSPLVPTYSISGPDSSILAAVGTVLNAN